MIGGGDSLVGGQEGTFANGALTTTSAPYFMVDSGATTNAYNFSGGKFTGSVWAKSNRVTRTTRFFNIQGSAPGAAYAEPTNAVQLIPVSAAVRARYSAGSTYNNATNAGTLVANTWSYLTMVVSRGTADTAKLYSNGALVQTVTSSTVLLPDTVRNYVFLGRGFGSATDSVFSGVMDEMTLANASRTPDWIMLSYKNQKIGVAPVFDLSYSVPTATYTVGSAITANNPTLTGSATRYVVSPALPTGLTISSSTGVISGIPGTPAASASYTIKAAGASDTVTTLVNITIQDTAPRVSYVRTSISAVSRMSIVPDTVLSTGGVVDSFTISPTLPSGLSLGKTSGLISGTPVTAAANVSYTITARGPGGTGTAVVSIVVADTAPAISYVRLGINGVKGVTIIPDSIVSVGGSVDSFVISPALPVGLTMSKSTGRISGTPSVISSLGVYTVTAAGPGGTGVTLLILGVADTAPAISYKRANISAVKGVVIVPDSVNSVGGVVDSFTVAPALPSGLSLGKTSGLISGTPSAVAVAANYTITARGPGGTGTVVVNITVQDTAPRIAYQTTPVTFGRNVSATPDSVISTGGTVTRYSVAPALPTGLLLDTSTGIISGIPTTLAGPANYTVTANGPGGTGTTVVNITVTDQTPVITYRQTTLVLVRDTSMAPDSSISTGGLVTRYSVSPSLPAGLFLDSLTGTVSGSPAVSVHPAVNYTVTATGPGGSASNCTPAHSRACRRAPELEWG